MFPLRRRRPVAVILYGRAGCCLCEDAAAALARASRRVKIDAEEVDIEADDRLLAEYALRIPVLVDSDSGAVLAEGAVDERTLVATLRRIAQSR